MNVNYIGSIILLGIERLDGERTTTGLYHLFNGKKSSQTVQDGRLFQLSHLFGIIKGYSYRDFKINMNDLHNDGLIEVYDGNHALITNLGKMQLRNQLEQHPIPEWLDCWRYGDLSSVFWRRITLFVQTLSHIMKGDHHFYPIQNDPDTLQWVKRSFPKEKEIRSKIASLLFQELKLLLQPLGVRKAENVVLRLTRTGRIGLTTNQVADRLHIDPMECHVHFQASLHHMMKMIVEDRTAFPVLSTFIADMEQRFALTESTRKTYRLIKKGLSLEEIASVRNLKPSTIEDHIVELAIHIPEMDIDRYIQETDQKRIVEASGLLGTKRLKAIKQKLGEGFNYFQIRLTLAKESSANGKQGGGMRSVD
ncbi:helix-turn-helix domain-containing protein [Alkalihalobacillus sp. TS-13]|uniref:helix-turn-helix domain-containing protein n=1 Tax=Alkalihalobacillus sp. TS-13 TaxID=2842455 RepID=UPI001C867457|nr:helix-turn-helix domain-containing protein [Alkalihalobacillus sp. TS-13]